MVTIDGHTVPVVRPTSVAEVCALVTRQRAKREAVYPVGGRTMLDFGLPPTKPGVALNTTALNEVIDYPAGDMTITVQAGITFAKLQATFAQHNQWLPLDVPNPERMTLGGLIACDVSGPRRLGYGTLRDYLIGISFVGDDGVEVKGGGRVVKNVAGYDLMKLHIGALGTMGVITQVTLKVRPRPEISKTWVFAVERGDVNNVLQNTVSSNCSPVAVEILPPYFTTYQYAMTFEGSEEVCEWQLSQLIKHLSRYYTKDTAEHGLPYFNDRHANPLRVLLHMETTAIGKVIMRPNRSLDFCFNESDKMSTMPFNGISWLFVDQKPWEESIKQWQIDAAAVNGSLTLLRCPTAWKTPERVFGPPTPAFELMRRIQRTLDPDGVFNPGRMF